MTTDTARRPGPFSTGPIAKSPGPIELGERDARFDNQPPLGERIAMEFEDDLRREGLIERAAQLIDAIPRCPKADCTENVGKLGDFVRQINAFEKALEAVREKHNRPLIDARTALKGRTDAIFVPLADALKKVRDDMNRWTREETARVERERREAAERAEQLRREAEAAAQDKAAATGMPAETFIPEITPRRVEAPVARGDLGARVGTRMSYEHKIVSVRKLPDRLLKHPKVIEALDKVIAAEIRSASGKCEISGVEITPVTNAAVR
jgi:hypothetical protein